jgi:hypothetical protein
MEHTKCPTKTEERAPTTPPKDDKRLDTTRNLQQKNDPILVMTKTKSNMDLVIWKD